MSGRAPEDAFWRHSLRLYARPGVAATCLALQDAHGADVNLLLFCCWIGGQGRRLDARALGRAVRAVAAWQAEVLRPLRGVRRALKPLVEPVPGPVAALRRRVAALELDAEHQAQRILARFASSLPPPRRLADPAPAAAANLARYLALLEVPAGVAEQATAVLLAPP